MKWSFRCWICGHSELGQYFQLPKTTCPKCGAGRTFTSVKRTEPTKEEPMPCYSVNTVSLDFQAGDLTLLQKAAAVLGLQVHAFADRRNVVDRSGRLIASLQNGKATCTQADVATVNRLRVQYSREIVGHAALKLGWQKSVKTENKFLLRKGV